MPNEHVSRTRYEQNKKFLQHLNKCTNKTTGANLIYKGLFLEGQMLFISFCNNARSCSFLMMVLPPPSFYSLTCWKYSQPFRVSYRSTFGRLTIFDSIICNLSVTQENLLIKRLKYWNFILHNQEDSVWPWWLIES